jgi:hypothetical protein
VAGTEESDVVDALLPLMALAGRLKACADWGRLALLLIPPPRLLLLLLLVVVEVVVVVVR